MSKKGSMIHQALRKLTRMWKFGLGRSKHRDKRNNDGKPLLNAIYSNLTYKTYVGSVLRFLRWVQANHACHNLDDARQYVAAYLQKRIDDDLSAWTIHTDASAIAKLYQCSYRDFGIKLPKRERKNRVKNRTNTLTKELEDNPNSKTVIDLCTNTGLRAHEVKLLKVSDVILDKYNNPAIWVQQGKGGKSRYIHPLDSVVFRLFLEKWQHGEDSLFPSIPAGIPIHFLRGEFARELYRRLARPLDQIPPEDQYRCRKDMKGVILDRRAMHRVSKELGHNRISVVTLYLS